MNYPLTIRQADLVRSWQQLLLAQTQLTQEHNHLAVPATVADRIPSVVIGCLVPACPPVSEGILGQVNKQCRQLSLGRKLWTVVKNVFSMSSLLVPAESILIAILEQEWLLNDTKVADAWMKLCSSLISPDMTSVMTVLSNTIMHEPDLKARRRLWALLACQWQKPRDNDWLQGVAVLVDPLKLVFDLHQLNLVLMTSA
jgi:hypothetical protein